MSRKYEFYVLPLSFEVEGCEVILLEVTKIPSPDKMYRASLSIKCGDAQTLVFPLFFKNSKELKYKIKGEVSKLKYFIFLYGKEKMKKLGIIK